MSLLWGISTSCMYPEPIEKTLQSCVSAGVPCTELFVNTFSEISSDFVRIYREILRNGQTKVVSVHPFTSPIEGMLLFTDYSRRLAEGIEVYKRYFDFAAQMGARFVVLHGALQNSDVSRELYLERYELLHRQAISQGVRLAQENVVRCMSKDMGLLQSMKEAIPDICFVLDLKQARRSECDPFEVLEVMGERIVHVHISDYSPSADCLPPGKGIFDFGKLVDKLELIHHNISLVLELYRKNFNDFQELVDSYEAVKNKGKDLS